MWDAASGLAVAFERAVVDLAGTVGGASVGWLALGVLLHLANQVARGRGWCEIVRSSWEDEQPLRRRDAIAAWVAGAGAGGVLSARGGDAVRVLLLSRRSERTRCPVLAGTLVAEAAGDALVGVTVVALAIATGLWPGVAGFDGAALWLAVAAGVLLLAALFVGRERRRERAAGRWPRVRAVVAGVGRGCSSLTTPGTYAVRILPWQVASRALRAAALFCFLAAFHLPATAAAVLLVMLAQSGGRLVPLGAGVGRRRRGHARRGLRAGHRDDRLGRLAGGVHDRHEHGAHVRRRGAGDGHRAAGGRPRRACRRRPLGEARPASEPQARAGLHSGVTGGARPLTLVRGATRALEGIARSCAARGERRFTPMLAPITPSLRLPTLSRGRTQIGIFLLAYLVYSIGRWLTVGDLDMAKANAHWIVDLEQDLGVATERAVQDALTGTAVLWVLNHLYLAAQLIVVPGALFWLYRRSRAGYERLRNTILATWLLSIPVYGLFPVAPPRLADVGLVDTITTQTGFAMDSKLTTMFYNELAAVPSLHVGFAFAVGIAIAAVATNRAVRTLALLWGPAISLAVVATGNHYMFDIAAGMVASVAGYGLGIVASRGVDWRAGLPVPALRSQPA